MLNVITWNDKWSIVQFPNLDTRSSLHTNWYSAIPCQLLWNSSTTAIIRPWYLLCLTISRTKRSCREVVRTVAISAVHFSTLGCRLIAYNLNLLPNQERGLLLIFALFLHLSMPLSHGKCSDHIRNQRHFVVLPEDFRRWFTVNRLTPGAFSSLGDVPREKVVCTLQLNKMMV